MEINQATYDRYADALKSYEAIIKQQGLGWERYAAEAEKIRKLLASADVGLEVAKILGNA